MRKMWQLVKNIGRNYTVIPRFPIVKWIQGKTFKVTEDKLLVEWYFNWIIPQTNKISKKNLINL